MDLEVEGKAGIVSDADRRFLARFERCELAEAEWTHEAHVHVAWTVSMTDGAVAAERRLREGILRFNTVVLGRPAQYHETVTLAFARIIRSRLESGVSYEDFLRRNEDILSADKPLLLRYYSEDRLFSDLARREFVPPDMGPLPRPAAGE